MSFGGPAPLYWLEVVTMSTAVVVQYRTRADAADLNQQLIEAVFDELHARRPSGLRYMALRLDDGVGFVHVLVSEADDDPLAGLPAFRRFQDGTDRRLVTAPTITAISVVGTYDGDLAMPTPRSGSK